MNNISFLHFIKSLSFLILLSLCQHDHAVQSANILFYHNLGTYSHRVVTYPLADAMAKRGHQVTYISSFHPRGPYVNPNITEIVPPKMATTVKSFLGHDFDINFRIQKTLPSNAFAYYPTAISSCEDLLTSPELKEYLQVTTKLDLIVLDNCFSECGMAIAYKYGSKVIKFNTITIFPPEHDIYGVTPQSSSIPELELFAPQSPMSFMERVENTINSIYFRHAHYSFYVKEIDELIRKYMGYHDMPFVDDLVRDNTSLVLHMGDIVTDYTRSLPPMIVNVGGLHCNSNRSGNMLPDKLKHFVEGGQGEREIDGFVYISLGSLVVSSNLPEETRQAFFETVEAFPRLKFLWKWNGQFPDKIPENLHLSKWFPQNDILAHPKLKGFITQSGRPSTLEALCAAIPMIAFPILGDQDTVANRMNEMGGNIKLELGSITKAQLHHALEKVVYDEKMKERMLELRNIFNDQPMSPLDTAVWWTEYVLRHKDTKHLKPAGFDQWWYQRRLMDVWAFLFTLILLTLVGIFLIALLSTRWIMRVISSKKTDKEFSPKIRQSKKHN